MPLTTIFNNFTELAVNLQWWKLWVTISNVLFLFNSRTLFLPVTTYFNSRMSIQQSPYCCNQYWSSSSLQIHSHVFHPAVEKCWQILGTGTWTRMMIRLISNGMQNLLKHSRSTVIGQQWSSGVWFEAYKAVDLTLDIWSCPGCCQTRTLPALAGQNLQFRTSYNFQL